MTDIFKLYNIETKQIIYDKLTSKSCKQRIYYTWQGTKINNLDMTKYPAHQKETKRWNSKEHSTKLNQVNLIHFLKSLHPQNSDGQVATWTFSENFLSLGSPQSCNCTIGLVFFVFFTIYSDDSVII